MAVDGFLVSQTQSSVVVVRWRETEKEGETACLPTVYPEDDNTEQVTLSETPLVDRSTPTSLLFPSYLLHFSRLHCFSCLAEEDGAMEVQEPTRLRDRGIAKKDRDHRDRDRDRERERDRLSRNNNNNKRRRGDRLMNSTTNNNRDDVAEDSSEESVNDDEEDDEDESSSRGTRRRKEPRRLTSRHPRSSRMMTMKTTTMTKKKGESPP